MTDIAQCREPLIFSIGDTMLFKRYLPDYLPSDGWSLTYSIRGGANSGNSLTFNSTTDGTNYTVTVLSSVTSTWVAGQYILVGFAVNGATRHQIYYAELTLTPNAIASRDVPNVDVLTHAQKMIVSLQTQLESLAQNVLQDSTVQGTELRRVRRKEMLELLQFYQEKVANEAALENVRNGRPSGQKIVPQFNITQTTPGWGVVTTFPPNG